MHFPSNDQIVHKISMQQRYFLKEVQLNNFKSFGAATKVSFSRQLSCVVGRNGCGKSALIDAICCCLGVDCKQLRCRKYSDLITHLEGKTAEKCSVQLLFENCSSEKNTITFGFTASRDGTTVYVKWNECDMKHTNSLLCPSFRYNGKMLSRERIRKIVTDQLKLHVHPDLLFVIQQNRIQHFCCNDNQFLSDFIMEVGFD